MLRTPGAATSEPLPHTPGHVRCPGCRARSTLGAHPIAPETIFREAFDIWLEKKAALGRKSVGRVKRLSANSLDRYRVYGAALCVMLGDIPIEAIHDGHLAEYEERRAICEGGWSRPCGQNCIRKETDIVRRVLRYAKVWTAEMDEAYDPLPMLDTDDQRALEPEKIQQLCAVLARKSEDSQWVLYDSVVALHTCASTNERRLAKIKDVMLALRLFRVGPEQSKNKYRNRRIPLETEEVITALEWLLRRARRLGANRPEHYLFPWRDKRGEYVPTRPMTRWCLSQQFEGVGREIGVDDLTPYDLRHSAMSMLANAGVPIDVILAYGGQVSEKMRKHYTTASMLAKRKAAPVAWSELRLLDQPSGPMSLPARKPPVRSSIPAVGINSVPDFPQKVA